MSERGTVLVGNHGGYFDKFLDMAWGGAVVVGSHGVYIEML